MNLLASNADLRKNEHYIKDTDFVNLLTEIMAQKQRHELNDVEIKRAVERLVLHGEIFDEN